MGDNRVIKKFTSLFLVVVVLFLMCSCDFIKELDNPQNTTEQPIITTSDSKTEPKKDYSYAVSTSNEYASIVGAEVLKAGGNAVDAAIAVAYTLSVVEPYASGIGGGGGMLIYDPKSDDYTFLNYMPEAAPSGTTANNIGVPGFVSGMQTAADKFGTIPLSELLKYAYDYAKNGFKVNEKLEYRINQAGSILASTPLFEVESGDTLVQPKVAETIKTIMENGSDDFYKGTIADKIVSGTSLKKSDLTSYKTIVDNAVVGKFNNYTIASAPAPYSGVQLIQMLKLMDNYNVPSPSSSPSSYFNSFVQIKLATGSDRASYLCDPKFSSRANEYNEHVSDNYLRSLLNKSSDAYKDEEESEDTTHVSIIDDNGLTVSMTNTLSAFWGSNVSVNGCFINNSLRNFSSTGINACQPGKRGRTFISPAIIKDRDDGSIFAIGTPGGNIITTVLAEVIADICLYGDNPRDAINKMRFTVLSNNSITLETGLRSGLIANPASTGFYIVSSNRNEAFGSINIAGYDADEEEFYAVADPRRTGSEYVN